MTSAAVRADATLNDLFRRYRQRIDASDPAAHNNLGYLLFQKGLIEDAIAEFALALELDPQFEKARGNLMAVERHTKVLTTRLKRLRNRLHDKPGDHNARLELARGLALLCEFDAAADEYRRVLDSEPARSSVRNALGTVLWLGGSSELALNELRKARASDPASPVIAYNLALACYQMGLLSESERVLRQLTQRHRHNAQSRYLFAFVLGEMGHSEGAEAELKRAVQIEPRLARHDVDLSVGLPSVEVEQARRAEADTSVTVAAAMLERGFVDAAERALTGHESAAALRLRVEARLRRGRYREALGMVERRRLTTDDWLETARAVALHHLGRAAEAEQIYRSLVECDVPNAVAQCNLGVLYAQAGRAAEAARHFRASAAMRPRGATLNLGHLQRILGKLDEALRTFKGLLESGARDADAWNGIGAVFLASGRAEDARNAFLRAVETEPDRADSFYNLSFALYDLGSFEESLSAVTRAQEIDPFYDPQGFVLLLDGRQGELRLPFITRRVDAPVQGFEFDSAQIDAVFESLTQPQAEVSVDRFDLARDAMAKGQLEVARAEVARARHSGAKKHDCDVLEGEVLLHQGAYGEALERFHRVLAESPVDRTALKGAAQASLGMNSFRATLDFISRIDDPENDPKLLVTKARALHGLGDGEAALRLLNMPAVTDWNVLSVGGEIALADGKLDLAKDIFRRSLEVDPRHALGWVRLGQVELQRRDDAAAIEAFREALEVDPDSKEAATELARLHKRLGNVDAAVSVLVDSLTRDPSFSEGLVELGICLLDSQRHEDALTLFQRVVHRDRHHATARMLSGVALAKLRRYGEAREILEDLGDKDFEDLVGEGARIYAANATQMMQLMGGH